MLKVGDRHGLHRRRYRSHAGRLTAEPATGFCLWLFRHRQRFLPNCGTLDSGRRIRVALRWIKRAVTAATASPRERTTQRRAAEAARELTAPSGLRDRGVFARLAYPVLTQPSKVEPCTRQTARQNMKKISNKTIWCPLWDSNPHSLTGKGF